MQKTLLFLAGLALACALAKGPGKSWVSVNFDSNTNAWTVAPGKDKTAVAYAYFENTVNATGWGKLSITSNAAYEDSQQMYAVGYLEGYLTSELMYYNWLNTLPSGQTDLSTEVNSYLSENYQWTTDQVAAKPDCPYWYQVGLVIEQLQGLQAGYNFMAPTTQQLSLIQVLSLSAAGDIEEITTAYGQTAPAKPSNGHCSSLIKVTNDYSEIYFGHTTWNTYTAMLRVYKWYSIPLSSNVSAISVGFSSYPGDLTSTDDFFTLSSGLAVTETTNGNYNQSLYEEYMTPTSGVLSWIRTMVANRMASSAAEWVEIFATANSGTYNNQWIILDYNLFTPGQSLQPNTLWIAEQMPGRVISADVTSTLQYGYWPSYNVPYFQYNFDVSEFEPQVVKYGPWLLSYDMASRAEIFRREQGKVETLDDFKTMMRYNHWQDDPFSVGNAGLSISSRFDLVNKQYPTNPMLAQAAFGGVDSKVTSHMLMQSVSAYAQSGPTHDTQAPFTWNDWPQVPHQGMPMTYNFTFELMDFSHDE